MQFFNPQRLEFALNRRGITQTALAELLGITPRQVRNYIKDGQIPDVRELSRILNFPVSFFLKEEELPELNTQAVSFRAKSRVSRKLQKQAINHGLITFIFNDWLEREFELKTANLPDYSDKTPEEAADELRLEWGLGNQPIGNMISLLESKGIRVFSLSVDTLDIDAFCTWHDNKPFIFLNTQKSAERSRFDAAHELGHLLRDKYSMQHYASGKVKENLDEPRDMIEKEANAFASAFLMPKEAIQLYRNTPITIDNLMKIKKIFGVSLVALAYRMHKLGIISDWLYIHVLCPQFAKKRYRTTEPEPMKKELSSVLKQILTMLKEDGVSLEKVASSLDMPVEDIVNTTFNLVEPEFNRYRKLKLIK
ncbi:XRE family transcriptional regulator [Neisseria sp. Dent CA1/247]|uniref:helix-turn-helix domain-containing protein n=1 Tax=Neisseria sp. Dent CA1/247 TaxID=2912675 RepID=UPI001FD057F1|nr:XRE family transcriptional regulator [Neisseria sp. Dent CA1/247]UOO76535.1 XRE family transcriptional regulator [Neisseria sp. Dent CA1/247]